jgi:hypothetical protein
VISQLFAPFQEVPIDREVAERAGRIHRHTGVRPPDAVPAPSPFEYLSS